VLALAGTAASLWAATRALRAPPVQRLRITGEHRVHTPEVVAGPRLRAEHIGAPHPARVALTLGHDTWVGTHSAGLLRYGASLWTAPHRARPTLVVGLAQGLPSPRINDLAHDGHELLVATDAGVARIDRQGRVRRVLLRGQAVRALGRGFAQGPLLAATGHGIHRLDTEQAVAGMRRLRVTQIVSCADRLYLVGDAVVSLTRGGWLEPLPLPLPMTGRLSCTPGAAQSGGANGRGGHLWAATGAGLYRIDGARVTPSDWERHTTTVTMTVSGEFRSSRSAPQGREEPEFRSSRSAPQGREEPELLFGTFGEGAFRRLPHRERLDRLLSRGRVSLIHAPTPRRILIGTDEGLFVVTGLHRAARLPLDGPPPGLVVALARRGGELWVGTFDAGLALRTRGGRWLRVQLPDPRITALARGPDDRIWVGTPTGLLVESVAGSRRLQRAPDAKGWLRRHINLLRPMGDRLWVGAYPGLVSIDLTDGTRPALRYLGAVGHDSDAGLSGTTINGVAATAGGLWAGGGGGLSLLAPGAAFALTDLDQRLPDNWINDVRVGGDTLHVLTLDAGLLQIAPRGSRTLRSKLMTSPSGMLLINGTPFLGSNRGLAVVRGPERILTFGPAQNQACATVTSLLHEQEADRLWLGGDAGLVRIERATALVASRAFRDVADVRCAKQPRPPSQAQTTPAPQAARQVPRASSPTLSSLWASRGTRPPRRHERVH